MPDFPTKTEVLIRAISDVLAPTGRHLRELGYDAELIVTNTTDGVLVKLVVQVVKT